MAISVEGLGKCYRIYDRPQDRLKQALRIGGPHFREFWALRNVSLQIRRGETAGIVGRNGCGKSTLLQLICGILAPTTGSVQVHGRVAALLELGAGFNPEFTGRENVFLNGAILGLAREEIEAKYDEIVSFSELGEFIDRPVKTYSSGMFVRLAFAVATSCEPDILVVDEAMAVGDEAFQRKCFSRLERIQERGGTILFFSHSAGNVLQLCDSAFLLDQGELLLSGSPQKVITAYQKLVHAPLEQTRVFREQLANGTAEIASTQAATGNARAPGTRETEGATAAFDPSLLSKCCVEYASQGAEISEPRITTLAGEQVNLLVRRETYVLRYTVRFAKPAFRVRFGTMIKSVAGNELGGTGTPAADCEYVSAGSEVDISIRFYCLLPASVYFVNVGLRGTVDEYDVFLHRLVDALAFRVLPDSNDEVQGMIDFLMDTQVEFRPSSHSAAA